MKHPCENFIRYLVTKTPGITGEQVNDVLQQWGILTVDDEYLPRLVRDLPEHPRDFNPSDRLHRPSMQYLRRLGVHELFFPTSASEEAWDILADKQKREAVEQVLLARLDLKMTAKKLNAKHSWHLTAEGMASFRHFFWNVPSLTFDEWGRYLYGRTALYEKYMGLLHAPPALAYYHLRLEQAIESKNMIKRTQEIAFYTLEEVSLRPGVGQDKVKAIGVLGKVITDCHASLNTSDVAIKDALKEFEKFRLDHPHQPPKDIQQIAPSGNYSGSGKKTDVVIDLVPTKVP